MTPIDVSEALTGTELVELAQYALSRAHSGDDGPWRRSAAVLARQSIEQSMAEVWALRSPGMADTSIRAQMIALPCYVESAVARRSRWAWATLSGFCHHRVYALPPALPTLSSCVDFAAGLAAQTDSIASKQYKMTTRREHD